MVEQRSTFNQMRTFSSRNYEFEKPANPLKSKGVAGFQSGLIEFVKETINAMMAAVISSIVT